MKDVSNNDARGSGHTGNPSTETPKGSSRRKLLGQIGATFAAGMLVRDASASGQSSNSGFGGAGASNVGAPGGVNNSRAFKSLALRGSAAINESQIPVPPHTTNGDEARYSDKSGTYTKGLLQDGLCRVNLYAYKTFKTALNSGDPADFEKIEIGGTRKLNGPQGGLAFDLEGSDSVLFGSAASHANQENGVVVPPAPALPLRHTALSWLKCTGRRCCATWHLPIMRAVQSRMPPRRSFRRCRPTPAQETAVARSRRTCYFAAPSPVKPLAHTSRSSS